MFDGARYCFKCGHELVQLPTQGAKNQISVSPTFVSEDVIKKIAGCIVNSFSLNNFKKLFKNERLSPEWTTDDALVVWYSLGILALVVVTWQSKYGVNKDKENIFHIIEDCRSKLVNHWNLSGELFDKLRNVINNTEAQAVKAYSGCKSSSDYALFFNRYVNRILGAAVDYSGSSSIEDVLLGVKYKVNDPFLAAQIFDLFVNVCISIKELLEGASIQMSENDHKELKIPQVHNEAQPPSKSNFNGSEVLQSAHAIHESLAAWMQLLLAELEEKEMSQEEATIQMSALFVKIEKSAEGYAPAIKSLAMTCILTNYIQYLTTEEGNLSGISAQLAVAAVVPLMSLRDQLDSMLLEEGWKKEDVAAQVPRLSKEIIIATNGTKPGIAPLTFAYIVDNYAKFLIKGVMTA